MQQGRSAPIQAWENNERGKLARHLVEILPMSGFAAYSPEIILQNETVFKSREIDFDLQSYGLPGCRLFHTPGHTMGSISLILSGGKQAIVGDLLFANKQTGRTKPLFHLFALDSNHVFESIRTLLDLGIQTFHGGHGDNWSAEQVRRLLDRTCNGNDSQEEWWLALIPSQLPSR